MNKVRAGDLYGIISIFGHTIEIRYGYYEERERERGEEPVPIYPDFKKHPLYTYEGYPLVTQMQELCEHGTSMFIDGCCVDCAFFCECTDLIGYCKNNKNKQEIKK